jgi:hypothetical protein
MALEDSDIKKRLTAVVECLIEYKSKLINKNTINITTPADLTTNTMPVLKQSCAIIKDFMIRHERPSIQDADLKACLDCLETALTPWDMDMSILCPEFCEKIFQGFNLNPDKIQIIKEIDLYCPRIDGVPDEI